MFVDELQMALPERANAEERKRAEAALYGSLNELKARPHTDIFETGANPSFLSDDWLNCLGASAQALLELAEVPAP